MSNVYRELTNVVCGMLTSVQISTLQVHNETLKLWTDSNQLLTTHTVSSPVVKWNEETKKYDWVEDYTLPPEIQQQQKDIRDAMNKVNNKNKEGPGSMSEFINTIFTGKTDYTYAMSEALGTTLLGFLQKFWDSETGSKSSAQMTTITNVNQLVTANSQAKQQPGQTAAKNQGSVISNDANVTTNLGELLSAVLSADGNGANLLANRY